MTSSGVRVTFLLKGINAKELIEKYNKGNVDIKLSAKKISINEYKDPTTRVYPQDHEQPSFCRKDKTGNTIVYHTTGNSPSSSCFWCRKGIEKGQYVGLPISVYSEGDKLCFYTDGYFCDNEYACAYAYYQEQRRDSVYADSGFLLSYVFSAEYPDKVIKAAPDWRLHERNGGSLKEAEFAKSDTLPLVRTSNYVPVRVEYRQVEPKK